MFAPRCGLGRVFYFLCYTILMKTAVTQWYQTLREDKAQRQIFFGLLSAVVLSFILATAASWWYVIFFAVALSVLLFAFGRPLWILFFLLCYLPFEPWLLGLVPDQIYLLVRYFSEALIYLLLARTVWQLVRERRFLDTPLNVPVLCLLGVALLSWLFNLVPIEVAAVGLRQIFRFVLLYFIVIGLNPSVLWMRRFVFCLIVLAGGQAVLGILQVLIGAPLDAFLSPESAPRFWGEIQVTSGGAQVWEYGRRVFGTLGRYDHLGTFLSVWLLVGSGLLYEGKKNRLVLLALLVGLLALVFTYSRASWFGFLAGIIVIGLWLKKDRRVAYGLGIGAVMLIILLIVGRFQVSVLHDTPSQTLSERVLEVFSRARFEGEYYGLGRLFFVVATVTEILPSSPILGVGPGQYGGGAAAALYRTTAYDRAGIPFGIYGSEGYIDNNWFSLLGELGILGLAVYLWIFWRLFKSALSLWQKSSEAWTKGLALGFIGVLAAVGLEAFLGTYLEVRTLGPYLWVLGGVIAVMKHET